jgi:hypothetical protein
MLNKDTPYESSHFLALHLDGYASANVRATFEKWVSQC